MRDEDKDKVADLRTAAATALRAYLEHQPAWDGFFTATFKSPAKSPWSAIERTSHSLHKSGRPARLFIAAEPHYAGNWHTHGLVAWLPMLDGSPRDFLAQNYFAKNSLDRNGWAILGELKSIGGTAGYCSKYLTKEREVEYMFYGKEWLPLDK